MLFCIRDAESGVSFSFEAEDEEEAKETALDWIKEGYFDNDDSTFWVDGYLSEGAEP